MEEYYTPNNNQDNNDENKIKFYIIDDILVYIFFIALKKLKIYKRKKDQKKYYLFKGDLIQNDFLNNNCYLKPKNETKNKAIDARNLKLLFKDEFYLRYFFAFIKYVIILNLINIIFLRERSSFIEFQSYNITLKIKGIGTKKVFSSSNSFNIIYHPNKVYINGNETNEVHHSYYLDQIDNYIELIWNNCITDCQFMFSGCSDIYEINLANFDTSKVIHMNRMFQDCSSLTSLNLSNFDTSKVIWMNHIFSGCSSLTSLDLSSFNTSITQSMHFMFENCINLEYINMKNFKDQKIKDKGHDGIFNNVPNNIVICIKKENILNKIYPHIENIACHIEDCSNDWKLKRAKIIGETNECINNCSDFNFTEYRYEENGKCYSNCTNGYYYDDNNILKCKCKLEKCYTCSTVSLNRDLCTKCNDNYYQMENDPSNIGEYVNCYNKNPKGYYFDDIDFIYKKCYSTCETCEIKGDNLFHNCLECNSDFKFEIINNNYSNCNETCSYYYYFDKEKLNFHCTKNFECPPEYPQLYDTKECKKADINYFENLLNEILKIKLNNTNEKVSKEEEINNYNIFLKELESVFTSGIYDLTNVDKGIDEYIISKKLLITFTNIENQKNNIESNMSSIDLGDCENLLRYYYNLTNNQTIYMKKIDVIQDETKAKKIEFNLYSRLPNDTLEKLNFTVCEKTKIAMNIPIEINGNIDKLNTSSGYFNDICYTTTSNDGTDVSLKDRKNEYIGGDNIICQDDCDFTSYDSKSKKAKCECFAKESNLSYKDMILNKTKLFENLKDISNLVNLNILICYKKLLSFISFKEIIHNIGSLIIICILILNIITIFIFYIFQLKKIEKIIDDILFGIKNINLIKKGKKKKKAKSKITSNKQNKFKKIKNKRINNNIFLTNKCTNSNISITTNIISTKKMNNIGSFFNSKKSNKNEIKMVKNIMNYNSEEINLLEYNLALKYDKRTFCQYFLLNLLSI